MIFYGQRHLPLYFSLPLPFLTTITSGCRGNKLGRGSRNPFSHNLQNMTYSMIIQFGSWALGLAVAAHFFCQFSARQAINGHVNRL
jgi:hypothetical protein